MSLYSMANYKYDYGQKISTDVEGYGVDKAFLAHVNIPAPAAASAVAVLAATALTVGAKTVKTGFLAIDFPRNVTIKGGASGQAGNVKITGTNIADEVITETIALSDKTEVPGTKAFKTVTEVLFPAWTADGDTVSIGIGTIFGLPYILDSAAKCILKLSDLAAANASSVIDVDADIELNVYKPASADYPNASKDIDLYIIV